MITASISWQGDTATEQIRLVALEAITRATVHLWTAVQHALNVPNTGERRKSRTRKTKGGRAASYTVYPHPSKPGEPPRKRTRFLQRGVQYAISKEGVGTVGIIENARYGLFLEVGTARMKARPFLLSTVQKELATLQQIVKGGR